MTRNRAAAGPKSPGGMHELRTTFQLLARSTVSLSNRTALRSILGMLGFYRVRDDNAWVQVDRNERRKLVVTAFAYGALVFLGLTLLVWGLTR